jgi:two-component system, cell cycle sensor histidine kinase and response regulator CckA
MGDLGPLGEAILATSPDLVIILNSSLEIVLHNDRARTLAERAGLLKGSGKSTATNRAWATVLARVLRGETVEFTTSLEGSSYDVHVAPIPSASAESVVERIIIHARDVTAMKAAELARLRLLRAVPDLVAILRRDGSVVEVKEAHDTAAQLTVRELDPARLRDALDHAFAGSNPVVFEQDVVVDGAPRHREAHVRAIADDEAVLLLRDVTSQRQLTSRLLVADRMASLGTLSAGVAHELNNPLAYITNNLDFAEQEIRRSLESETISMKELLESIIDSREGVSRMTVIVKDLKTFSRPDEETLVDVDVNRLLDRIVAMAMSQIKYRGQLEKTYGEVAPVRANEARLGQVFLNLLVNAAQSFDERNKARNVIRVRTGMRDGRTAIEVADNGPGIPPENRVRVFDPFFTTKPLGVGTGLGLAICLGIVKSMGGEIQLESAEGEGTIFRVLIPAGPAFDGGEKSSFGRIPVATEKHAILAIDDDPNILSGLLKILRGHAITVCGSAAEALHKFENGDDFDLILCDVMMPAMSGVELYQAVAKRWPGREKRIALMTGGALTSQTRGFLEQNTNVVVLEKPFGLPAVQDCLQRLRGSMVR